MGLFSKARGRRGPNVDLLAAAFGLPFTPGGRSGGKNGRIRIEYDSGDDEEDELDSQSESSAPSDDEEEVRIEGRPSLRKRDKEKNKKEKKSLSKRRHYHRHHRRSSSSLSNPKRSSASSRPLAGHLPTPCPSMSLLPVYDPQQHSRLSHPFMSRETTVLFPLRLFLRLILINLLVLCPFGHSNQCTIKTQLLLYQIDHRLFRCRSRRPSISPAILRNLPPRLLVPSHQSRNPRSEAMEAPFLTGLKTRGPTPKNCSAFRSASTER